MVRLKGPGMARDASGSLADTLIFSKWKGVAYLKKHAKPKQPRSQTQVSFRSLTQLISTDWKNFTTPEKLSWTELAARTDISPFNACIAFNMRQWGMFKFPTRIHPPTRTGVTHTGTTITVVQQGRGAYWTFTSTTINDGWGLSIHHVAAAFGPATYQNCIRRMALTSPGTVHWLWTPLDPATYNFRVVLFSVDGYGFTPGGNRNVVIT